jgi:hypothetical protein
MVGVNAPPRQLAFEGRVACGEQAAGARPKCLALKTAHQGFEHRGFRRGNHQSSLARFAEIDLMSLAKVADLVYVTEKIERPDFIPSRGAQNAAPDDPRIIPANRLTIFVCFHELQANGTDIGTKIQGFDIEQVHLFFSRSFRRELLLKIGRLLSYFKPIEKCVRCIEPDCEPAGDFYFLRPLLSIHFVISGDHFRAALP